MTEPRLEFRSLEFKPSFSSRLPPTVPYNKVDDVSVRNVTLHLKKKVHASFWVKYDSSVHNESRLSDGNIRGTHLYLSRYLVSKDLRLALQQLEQPDWP